ncbi:hypothetical protein SteCoe_37079 [Stentor coeruleus]|uniref:Ubiquitin carboxyl-terminal hydrolase n=1 Tax=Stentor coeruleus TaxID=5963 RepID=A0A1R2AP04_9CILI|nr:hypothetical protein SteCoe_37079 [Stentor coeruleus]
MSIISKMEISNKKVTLRTYKNILKYLGGEEDDVTRIGSYPIENTEWYIISSTWMKKFHNFFKQSEKQPLSFNLACGKEDIGEIDNSDIIIIKDNYYIHDYAIKSELVVNYHFFPVCQKIWNILFDVFGCNKIIKRKSILTKRKRNETRIEYFYAMINMAHVFEAKRLDDEFMIYHVSIKDNFALLIDIAKEKYKHEGDYFNIKFWKIDENSNISSMLNNIFSNESEAERKINGQLFKETTKRIEKLQEVTKKTYFFADIMHSENQKDSFVPNNDINQSQHRPNPKVSEKKELNKYSYSQTQFQYYIQSGVQPLVRTDRSRMGHTGLQNLGNTCYMNATLQCLSNTRFLTEFFLSDQYLRHINTDNENGSKCELVKEYAIFIKEVWFGAQNVYSPWNFKRVFSDIATQFIGTNQQDSHEMLSYLLEKLHENLNRSRIKKPENEVDNPEEISSEKCWNKFTAYNDSFIVETFFGQLKSILECSLCGNKSVTYDPFNILTLDIPKEGKDLKKVLVFINLEVIRVTVNAPNHCDAHVIKDKVGDIFGFNSEELIIADIKENKFTCILKDNDRTRKKMVLAVYKKNVNKLGDELISVFLEFKSTNSMFDPNVPYPRLVEIMKMNNTKDLYMHLFEYLTLIKGEFTGNIQTRYREKFSKSNGGKGKDDFFTIKTSNISKKPCAVCRSDQCFGCYIPYGETLTLEKMVENAKESNIKIAVLLKDINQYENILKKVTERDSLHNLNFDTTGKRKYTLENCLDLFTEKEQLAHDNRTMCSKCFRENKGYKTLKINRLPKVLIIHLKRFKKKNDQFSNKRDDFVEFPIDKLNMQKYSKSEASYNLFAITNHTGNIASGHYTAQAKCHDGQWREFDDNTVTAVNRDRLVSKAAYVLFYSKANNKIIGD